MQCVEQCCPSLVMTCFIKTLQTALFKLEGVSLTVVVSLCQSSTVAPGGTAVRCAVGVSHSVSYKG